MLFSYPESQLDFIRARALSLLFYAVSLVQLPDTEKLALKHLLNNMLSLQIKTILNQLNCVKKKSKDKFIKLAIINLN